MPTNANDFSLVESDPDVVEDAVKYIIFLVDADRLFDTALGMYDFSLVLMIAQHAQKVDNSTTFDDEANSRGSHLGSKRISSVPPGVEGAREILPKVQDR